MKKIKYILYILSSFLLLSCGEDFFDSIVEVEVPEHESRLAVTAHLTNLEKISFVHVTHTLGILDNQNAEPINDAKVELYKNGELFQTYSYMELYESQDQNGNRLVRDIYLTENPAPLATNADYELRVSAPNRGEISATQKLVPSTPIINATYEEDGISGAFEEETTVDADGNEMKERAEEIAITFQDIAGEKNFYAVQAIGFYDTATPSGIEEYGNPFYLTPVDPSSEEGVNALILSDATFDGKEYELKMAAWGETEGLKRIKIILYSIPEDRYLYEKSIIRYEENDGNPFAEPVIIHENILNGNGIFTVSAGAIFEIEL